LGATQKNWEKNTTKGKKAKISMFHSTYHSIYCSTS